MKTTIITNLMILALGAILTGCMSQERSNPLADLPNLQQELPKAAQDNATPQPSAAPSAAPESASSNPSAESDAAAAPSGGDASIQPGDPQDDFQGLDSAVDQSVLDSEA